MSVPQLETPRLLLEPLRQTHTAELYPIYADAATMRFWHTLPHTNIEATARLVQGELAHAAAPSWIVRLRDGGTIIGRVDFIAAAITGMGYSIWSPYWRRGYASEAAAAALAFGFQSAGYDRVELWIHEANIASQRTAAKLGFRQRGQFRQRYEHHAAPFETQVWGLRAHEWAAQAQPAAFVPPAPGIALYSVSSVIEVRDIAATIRFYVEQLGFDLDYSRDEPATFAILGRGEWTPERVQLYFTLNAGAHTSQQVYLLVSNVDALYQELLQRGAGIEQPPVAQPYGRRELGVRDPNGLLLVFASNT